MPQPILYLSIAFYLFQFHQFMLRWLIAKEQQHQQQITKNNKKKLTKKKNKTEHTFNTMNHVVIDI